MDDTTRALVRLAASLNAPQERQVLAMDEAAERAPEAAEEVLLQSYLFMGFPVALNAFGLWRRRTGRPAPAPLDEPYELWERRGEAVCGAVYEGHYEELRELMANVHPDLDRWAVTEGYGKVLGRPGLDLRTRELCVAAMLVGLNTPRQLHSHLRGCLNVGVLEEGVEELLETVAEVVPAERAEAARRVWERVRMRWATGRGEQNVR